MQSCNHDFFLCWCCVLRWIWCLWCYSECIFPPNMPGHGGILDELDSLKLARWEYTLRVTPQTSILKVLQPFCKLPLHY
jgi:hypothetical protein